MFTLVNTNNIKQDVINHIILYSTRTSHNDKNHLEEKHKHAYALTNININYYLLGIRLNEKCFLLYSLSNVFLRKMN